MKTTSQAKADIQSQGKTLAQWAAENDYPVWAVYRVIAGVNKCNYGRAHDIAVKLGLKPETQQAA